jgi:hypothetical protein
MADITSAVAEACRSMSKEEATAFLNKMSVLFKVDHYDDMAKEYKQVEYVCRTTFYIHFGSPKYPNYHKTSSFLPTPLPT